MADFKKQKSLRVGMISLGCAKNLVDTEIMLGTLLRDGVEVTNEPVSADVIIVNTCSFIDAAQEESVDTILESAEVRKNRRGSQALVVAGCLSQRFRDELPRLFPEVDAFMGIDQVARVTEIVRQASTARTAKLRTQDGDGPNGSRVAKPSVMARLSELDRQRPEPGQPATVVEVTRRPKYIPDYATPRFRLTPSHFAYLKIAEGCNHPCSFCAIPAMRGSHRSRSQADVVAEAKALLAEGVKELNLISQDSTYYGLDLRPNHSRAIASPVRFSSAVKALPARSTTLSTLLRELNGLPGDFWIRLLYTHPAHWTDELIRTIAECPKVARYVDIPLQHIHGNMLERMRRETSSEHIEDLLRRIRDGIPGIALRTTFIVGFPGETEEYFQTLLDFMRRTRFERLGVFTYSREAGTRAAKMAGQVPERTRRRRHKQAMELQRQISQTITRGCVGRTMRVLVERETSKTDLKAAQVSSWEHGQLRSPTGSLSVSSGRERVFVARGEADAPDIDGRVYIRGEVTPGEFASVKIVGCTDYDLIAEPVS
jgi:ribosomal protein S12 methylthiotransferase